MPTHRSSSGLLFSAPFLAALAATWVSACSDDGSSEQPGTRGDSGGRGGTGSGTGADAGTRAAGEGGGGADGGMTNGGGTGNRGGKGATNGGAGDGGSGGSSDAPSVQGIVTAFRPNDADIEERVPGAVVTLDDGTERFSAESDGNGVFSFAAIPPGEYRAKVTVSARARAFHDGMPYGDWHGAIRVEAGQTASLMPLLNLGCVLETGVDPGLETTFSTFGGRGCGSYDLVGALRVPAGGLVRENGEAFTGNARLEYSPIWFPPASSGKTNFTSLGAMPPLVGVPQGETTPETMHTFAAADIRVLDGTSGEPLALGEGVVADLEMRGFRELGDDDEYTSWSFDPERGVWREEGACVADASDPQLVHCEVKHFSWWNADGRDPEQTGGGAGGRRECIYGGVLYRGEPVIGASVFGLASAGILGAARGVTDEQGAFCAYGASGGGDWGIEVRVSNGREILSEEVSVGSSDERGDCDEPSTCAQAGVIELESSPAITVRGVLGLDVMGEHEPMPRGGFSFGTRVRAIGSPDDFGIVQLNLGEVSLASDGSYEFDIPEAIVRIFFVSPDDGECKTYPSMVPGEGNPVDIAEQFFICGS